MTALHVRLKSVWVRTRAGMCIRHAMQRSQHVTKPNHKVEAALTPTDIQSPENEWLVFVERIQPHRWSRVLNIFVGNLPYTTTSDELRQAFAAYGEVKSANVIMDRDTGRSRGFGFVEMDNSEEATAAIQGLNGSDLGGRQLTVNEARPRAERGPRRDF